MQKIMDRFDVFELPDLGLIIGATNPALDSLSHEQILNLIGNKVEILKSDGSCIKADVIDAEISTSLIGRKNISIRLARSIKAEDVRSGVAVYGSGVMLREVEAFAN